MNHKMIKLFDPVVGKEEEKAIKKVLHSKHWASGAGTNNVLKFEKQFSKYVNSSNCISVTSGTAALHLALSLFDIKNKEVILPSLSFVSTAHSILYNGGIPVFVDVDPKTLCIDPKKIQKSITKKTKLIVPVHFGGMPCNLDQIQKICKSFDIQMVEDAAHAAGASFNNKKIGSHGTAVCFSFHPVKNLAMPTGGAITLNGKNSQKFETTLKSLRWCGITNRKESSYDVDKLGWNYYLNEFSAAVGIEQLKKLKKSNRIRQKIAKIYSNKIELENKMSFDSNCSYHLYWIQVKNRKNFMIKMKENGIETGIHYKPIHTMSYYKKKLDLPITDSIAQNLVSIPIHPNLSNSNVEKIIKIINKFG
jgi:perosamine synthetase